MENPDYEYYSPQRYIFLSSVLEYITLEILFVAGNVANIWNKKRIQPLFIYRGIDKDDELNYLIECIFDSSLDNVIYS